MKGWSICAALALIAAPSTGACQAPLLQPPPQSLPEQSSPAPTTALLAADMAAARARAAEIDLSLRARRHVEALPEELKADLIAQLTDAQLKAQSSVLRLAEARQKPAPPKARTVTQKRLTSWRQRFALLGEAKAYLQETASKLALIGAAEAAVPTRVVLPPDYKDEYIMPALFPTYALCANGVWDDSKFVYRSQIDRVMDKIKQIADGVGVIKVYRPGSPGALPLAREFVRSPNGSVIAVGPDTVMTNQHVVELMAVNGSAVSPSLWHLRSDQRFIVVFPEQTKACEATESGALFEVIDIVWPGGERSEGGDYVEDFAVLRVKPLNGGSLRPVIFQEHPAYTAETKIGVIGYPDSPDPRDYLKAYGGNGLFPDDATLEGYFDLPNDGAPKYGIERFSYGSLIDLGDPYLVAHDATTNNSSSGSVLIALDTGQAIGMHAGGRLGTGGNTGANLAFKSDFIATTLRQHGIELPISPRTQSGVVSGKRE